MEVVSGQQQASSAATVAASEVTRPAATQVCPDFHAAVEMVGRRWTGAILFALFERTHYFAELVAAIPGLSDRLLSQRLRELEAEGLVERSVHPNGRARVCYRLTAKGRDLEAAIGELHGWAQRWNGGA